MRILDLPIFAFVKKHLIDYATPMNLTYLWNFGVLAGVCLVIQIVTGIFLAMHYTPHVDLAFASVEHIMRDVNYGWLLRYVHANGASMFFIVVYVHIFRGLYYGSYLYPRELVWVSGVIILLLMMATAFLGYVLPWGQMSFWGATVITNLFSAIPVIGDDIVTWLWGGFSVGNATLNRFFSFHFAIPFILAGLALLHLLLLHEEGSNNPLGVDLTKKSNPTLSDKQTKVQYKVEGSKMKNVFVNQPSFKEKDLDKDKQKLPFHPYFTVKDLHGLIVFLIFFSYYVFFNPNELGHPDNYIQANPMVTPAHIVPEWYYLPFYAILRSIPDKLLGVLALVFAILILLITPIVNFYNIRSSMFQPLHKKFFWIHFLVSCLLCWLGACNVETPYVEIGQVCTLLYFGYYLVILPVCSLIDYKLMNRKVK
uniref:apocytochrome b n=1 Tax=Meteora sporadica TaxID=2913902 RepID=UPI003003030F|nr:apocytochrome b [Meteora sporadica]WVH37080.1 apocytochrome b [Meteora sporadica]